MVEVFKTALNGEEICTKCSKLQAKHFEIQLLSGDEVLLSNEDRVREIIMKIPDVVSVHSRLTHDNVTLPNGNVDIKFLEYAPVREALIEACSLADMCAKRYNHPIGIVVHNSLSYDEFIKIPSIKDTIVDFLDAILNKVDSRVELWIENVTLIKVEDRVIFRNGTHSDTSDIALYLNSVFGGRVFTVFDTCHAMTTARILNAVGLGNVAGSVLTETLRAFSRNCKEVHLSNVINYGFNKGEHGCGFIDMKDTKDLEFILTLIKEYVPTAFLCYEIGEKDYLKNENTIATRKNVIVTDCVKGILES